MTTYLIVKALHIIAVICWFAGLFYLPRLFVYHSSAKDFVSDERFKIMERRLYKGIMWPSMITTWFFGLWLMQLVPAFWEAGWLYLKLALVVLLTFYHLWCGHTIKRFANQQNRHPEKFFRWMNEAPTVILLASVFLVVLKPF